MHVITPETREQALRDDGGARARWEQTGNVRAEHVTPGAGHFGTTYGNTMAGTRTQSAPSSTLGTSLAKPLLTGNHLSHAGARVMTPPSAVMAATAYPPDVSDRIQQSINAERDMRTTEHAQRAYETQGRAGQAVQQRVAQIPHAQNMLRATWGTSSSYQQDYGKSGTRP